MEDKIIQIMPAPTNMFAVYGLGNGEEFCSKIICLGLTSSGDILLLDSDDSGFFAEVADAGNFLRVEYK